MQAGKLRYRLIIEEMIETIDSMGEADRTWSTLDTVAGSVSPMSGRERIAGGQVMADVTHKVLIRYHPMVSETCRIHWGARLFDIVAAIDPDERHEKLELLCKEAL
jgi:SPP1 family predicted phage head-tail adaptor